MTRAPEPFLKWAGGKRGLRFRLLEYFPDCDPNGTYFEPFLGGGAVFFALQPRNAALSDINAELIEAYVAVRDDVDAVLESLSRLPYSENSFYKIRAWRPKDRVNKAARFIYLNKTCFNGLYRVNKCGEFNVPFGRHGPNLTVCDHEQLRGASSALAASTITSADFEESLALAKEGDLVYCDPPYTTAHTNNGFVEYNARVFSWDDQRRLAQVASDLVDRGVFVVVSNADHCSIVESFTKSGRLEAMRLERWSTIAGSSSKRFRTSELVFVNRGVGIKP